MSSSLVVRTGAIVAATSLALMAAGPALAVEPVAQASAAALTLSVAGNGTDSGRFTATHDGSAETTSGTNSPAVTALGGQTLTNLGTLAQDATATSANGAGSSAACSGVAGEGATAVQAGDGTSCLVGGRTITLDAANVDLTNLEVADDDALRNVAPEVTSLILGPVSDGIRTVLDGLGNPGLYVDLGAVQAVCTATTSSAQGSANIANGAVYLQGPGVGRIDLVDLPLNPAPNTKVVTDLSGVLTTVQTGLDREFAALSSVPGLDAALAPLNLGLNTLVDQLKANVTDALGPQLAPVEQNLLDLTLNKQSRPASNAVEITALDLRVVPAAAQYVDADLLALTLGTVTCGPNARVAAPAAAPAQQPMVAGAGASSLPLAVTSGVEDLDRGPSPFTIAGLTGLVLAGTAAGVVGFRRSLQQ